MEIKFCQQIWYKFNLQNKSKTSTRMSSLQYSHDVSSIKRTQKRSILNKTNNEIKSNKTYSCGF